MKTTFKFLGIIVLTVVIGFAMTACEEPEDPVVLNWTQGTLSETSSEAWHSFNVTSGTTYHVFVKEFWSLSVKSGDGYADVKLAARYGSKEGTVIFEGSELGFLSTTTPSADATAAGLKIASNFTANQDGTVWVRVYVEDGLLATYGLYKVAVTKENKRPSGE